MNKYNPNIHHRRSIRLKGYDYSQAGMYFITICCQNMICRFGYVENSEMQLNEYGKIAYLEWAKLPQRYPFIELDVFQIMPNHMHGILVIVPPVGAGFTPAHDIAAGAGAGAGAGASPARTVGDIVGAYKSLVANECLKIYKSKNEKMGKIWQRNYYEHIIRNDGSYQRIANYIVNNPAQWQNDKFNPPKP